MPELTLTELLEADGVRLHGRTDGERWGACPKCGGRDRFHVRRYAGREWFFCRQCHPRRGDAIEYLRWTRGMGYRDALAVLGVNNRMRPAARAAITTPRGVVVPDCLDEAPPADWQAAMSALVEQCAADIPAAVMRYLREERGLTEETIQRCRLGYNPKAHRVAGRWWIERGIVIPTFYAGHLWRVNVRRRADDVRDGRGKYIAAAGSRAQLFNGDALAGQVNIVLVCAGEFDAMLAQQHAPSGMACVTFGSETKRPTWEFDYLTRNRKVYIAFDRDEAGEQAAAAWAALGERVAVPTGKDITDYVRAGGDLTAWLVRLVETDDRAFEDALIEWLDAQGYEPYFDENGNIVAARPNAR